eukprot:XP_017950293.1 PREDICTED: A-kinase anchor protein 9 isoform X6 [Xenopus tropicalis]
MEEEDQERKRKLEAGKAKLAQFRQRKGQADGQHAAKKPKKKKASTGSKGQQTAEDAQETSYSQSHHSHSQSTEGASATEEFSIMRTLSQGESVKHDKTYTIEPESEISSTADDYSSEVTGDRFPPTANSTADLVREEEEFEVRDTYSEQGTCSSLTRLEVMEDELAGKQQEIEELNKELEEMRAACGTQGLQQLQEFEMAIKQRDDIITQLTTNLQQARKEKDEIMKEFLELTEQSQKLKIQFQHLQASEALRNNSHTSTAADLLQSKQQILAYQQQLEEQEHRLKLYQKDNESYKAHNESLQAKIQDMEQLKELELSYKRRLNEKDVSIDNMKIALQEEESKSSQLTERISLFEKSAEELRQELVIKHQEINNLAEELSSSRQRERQSSEEIKQLMGTVEELQKKHYKGTQFEADIVQRMELEAGRKLEQLRAELDEMYGQQIVQMKQELVKQHASEIEKLLAQHKAELDNISIQSTVSMTNEQINELNITINKLNAQLQCSNQKQTKIKEDFSLQLKVVTSEKSLLQGQIKDLLQDMTLAREQIQKAKESITEKESKLSEASSLLVAVDDLKAELAAANAYTKELQTKHESEITNYKIKLDMLEREKDAVLDRMAESQEAEFEKLRTHFLFSQEEELSKLREDLTREHSENTENLKQNLETKFRQQLDNMQHDMNQTISTMQSEKDTLVTKQNNLMLEISKLKDLLQSVGDPQSEEMMIQMNELQKDLEPYRREEKEKETTEQDFQMLQLKIKLLEKEVKEKDTLSEQIASQKVDIRILRDENNTLQATLKNYNIIGSVSDQGDDRNSELRNEMEKLTLENKQLKKLEFTLKEELERQKNTFSFAEKNFEVNFHELQEEYTCLLKIKNQLEDSITKKEEEYSIKLNSLNKELAKLKGISAEEHPALQDIKDEVPGASELVKIDALEVGEVVEKDTTELMEKLEIAQRDKKELSLKLFDLSEQMQLKQNEINQLKEHVKSLCQERDNALSDLQKQEKVIGVKETLSAQSDKKTLNDRLGIMSNEEIDKCNISLAEEILINEAEEREDIQHLNNCSLSHLSAETHVSKVEKESEPHIQKLHELSYIKETESPLLVRTQKERDSLQQELATLHAAQADMKLHLEAQQISLTLIHNAQIELINENLQKQKENELCSLKKEMLKIQELKIKELHDVHQQELQALQLQQAGGDTKSCQVLIDLLNKRISDERDHIIENIRRSFLEKKLENIDGTENIESSLQESSYPVALEHHLTQVQTKYTQMTNFLEYFLKEYKQTTNCYSNLEIERAQTFRDDLDVTTITESLTTKHSPVAGIVDVQGAATSQSEEVEKLKMEFSHQRAQLEEKHSQEIEHLRFYFQQQLKENEERYTTEIIHLQEHIQNVSETSLDFRELSKMQPGVEVGLYEADIFKTLSTQVTATLKMDEQGQVGGKPVKKPSGSIYHQLQTLRQAFYARYLEEVSALKKQHEAELIQLREDLEGKYYQENATLKEQIKLLTKAEQEDPIGNIQKLQRSPVNDTEGKTPADVNQLLEERYQERIQEEVAKVIVEMTVAFAQKTELARLAAPIDGGTARFSKGSQGTTGTIEMREDKKYQLCHGKEESLRPSESLSSDRMHLQDGTEVLNCVTSYVTAVSTDTTNTSLSQELNDDLHPKDQDKNVTVDSHFSEKTVVLKEEDYNRMLAMGAENAKLRPLYEEHVEDMRQELVRLEQEHQQSVEALKYSHMEQLERQMYDQEQLLSELHMVRAQLNVNASISSQTSELEELLEEPQSPETEENWAGIVQDNSSQTLEEHVAESESKDEFWDGVSKKEEGNKESEGDLPDEPICDRKHLMRSNKQLLKILLEIVKTTGAVEETIGHHVLGLLDKPGRRPSAPQVLVWNPANEDLGMTLDLEAPKTTGPIALKDFIGSKDADIWSEDTEEELDLTDRWLAGAGLSSEDEAQVLHISARLQTAVEKLLEAINESNNQLEHVKAAQTELVRESIKRKQETADLLRCQEELQERLNEEAKAREHLALELSRAEGLLDGYSDERVFLEKQIQEKNDLVRHLEQELQSTGNRLQEFEQELQQLQEERELLSRQKNALRAEATPAEQSLVAAAVDAAPTEELIEETEKLLKEKIEVQRQAEKDSGDLYKQVKVLETELEEQMSRNLEIEQEKNSDLEDLQQKNLSLEKQLEKTRKFLDEQAVDREHERDVFQQEILKLEQQLKMPQRHQPVTDHQSNALEKLETNLKEKTDKCNELLLCKEQFQRDIQERNEEIEKLECRIRELEQALLISDDTLKKVELRRQSIVISSKGEIPLEAQLQVERDAIDRKEKEITNLEEQLEQFREELENKNEEVQQLHMQLEIQRKESSTRLLELEQENKVLKDENVDHDNQSSAIKTHHMKPEEFEDILFLKEQEIDQLNEHVGRLQAQLETATDNKTIEDKNNQIKEYKSQIKCLKSDQERLKRNSEEEIEKLNEVIEKLQDELASIDNKVSVDVTSMTEDADSSKHQLETIMAEKDLLQKKVELSDTELAITRTALEETRTEIELLKTELKSVREGQIASKQVYEECNNVTLEFRNDKEEEAEATSEPLENSLLYVQHEAMQDTIHGLESKLQELKQTIKEKDIELLQYYDKVKLVEEQSQVIDQLNQVIRKLQEESTAADSVFNSIEVSDISECQNKTTLAEEMSLSSESASSKHELLNTELEETQAELKSLKEELEKLKQSPENANAKWEGKAKYDIKKLENALREKTAELLASQALLSSVQDTVQSTIQNLESQVQNLQKVVEEKDSELLQYAVQKQLLEKQAVELEQLNGVIESLHQKLSKAKQIKSPEKVERAKDLVTDKMQKENRILQTAELNGEETAFVKIELENAKEEIKHLRGELDRLQASLFKSEEALSEKAVQPLENQALSASAEEAMQRAMKNMESQLQELQIDFDRKDLELLQCSNEIELLEEQVKTERNRHDEVMLAMENTLREKVAAALVSEAQVKAIQLMQKTEDSYILQEESKGTQTSKSHEEEVAESNLSALSLRLLQLEKQLSDLHEELQVERERAIAANHQVAEKEQKLTELQHLLDCSNSRSDEKLKEKTSSKGGVKPDSVLPTSYQFVDTTSSDTGSDWSQGAYVPNFESVPDGVRSDDEVATDLLPNKIKNLLRAVHQESIQVLSLTEPDGADSDSSQSFPANMEPWLKERKTLLETIASLKDLIGKMQIHKEAKASESPDLYDLVPDWRGELLRAIQEVFDREQDVLLSAFHTQLASLGTCDAAALMNQMQHRLQEQGMEQVNAMDCIQNADRRSLLLEVQDLRSQLLSLRNDVAAKPPSVSLVEDMAYQNLEQDHTHQIQEMHLQLNRMSVRSSELEEQLSSERHLGTEVKNELAQTKIELESALSQQHKHFKELESLRLEIKQRSDELDAVSETLENEQKKTRELQWALEKEKAKVERSEERGKEELEDLKMLVDTQSEKIKEISNLLENEKQKVKDLQERMESREIAFDAELSQEKSKAAELQAFLDEEKTRCKELINALDCRTKLHTQLQKCEGGEQSDSHSQADDLLKDLQSQLEVKHHRIVELVGEMEAYKLECVQLRRSIEEEKQSHRRQIEAESDSGKAAHIQAQELKTMVDDLQQKLNAKTVELQKVKADEKRLKETIQGLENNNQQVITEHRSARRELGASTSGWKSTTDTPRSNGHQQSEESTGSSLRQIPSIALNGDYIGGGGPFSVETIRERLQKVSDKLKCLSTKANQRILFESVDHEDLTWSKNSIQEIIYQLGQVAVLSLDGENFVFPPGISTNTLTEKLLTQNAELTGYVSRLTEEKNDLRNALLRLEEEACRHRLRGPSGDHSFGPLSVENTANIDMLIASERELWIREKIKLQKSLKQTEAELSKVKAELRNETTQKDFGRESENTALKRVYSKYLRAESFRKALVYQKKYLLLLLGGFQECEEATLALIARMGGQPSYTDLEVITHHTRAFTRFRSAVRVSIAISRMKFLVRRWQRATGSSPSSINRNVFGQITGNELRTESPYPPAGSLELYGEQRHLACRSRSEFDSPQSTVNSQHRYNAVSDVSPCSYLRNYDPDRALTDYITRLEALQKRLGSAHTGSSNTSHYSTRR